MLQKYIIANINYHFQSLFINLLVECTTEIVCKIADISQPEITNELNINIENKPGLYNEWSEDTAIQEFPTNAVGEIHFINEDEGSIKPSK